MSRIEELEDQVRSLQHQLDKREAEALYPRSIPRSALSHSGPSALSRSNILFAILFLFIGYLLSGFL
jgi:hypothetical protein